MGKKKTFPVPISIRPNQLHAARAMLGWSRVQCAKLIGISPDTIKSIEYGKCIPEPTTVNKIISGFLQSGVSFVNRGEEYGIWITPVGNNEEDKRLDG